MKHCVFNKKFGKIHPASSCSKKTVAVRSGINHFFVSKLLAQKYLSNQSRLMAVLNITQKVANFITSCFLATWDALQDLRIYMYIVPEKNTECITNIPYRIISARFSSEQNFNTNSNQTIRQKFCLPILEKVTKRLLSLTMRS